MFQDRWIDFPLQNSQLVGGEYIFLKLYSCVSIHAHLQNMITENPFTDPTALHEGSPIELGEALGPLPENMAVKGRSRKQSNPFRPTDEANLAWELEKQQFTAQMTLLREQLKQETSARIESQVKKKQN